MSIPPFNKKDSASPSGKPSPTSNGTQSNQKAFQLPSRKQPANEQDSNGNGEEEQPVKKKGLFDLTMEDIGIKSKQPNVQEGMEEAEIVQGLGVAEQTTAVQQVQQVGQLIQKMVQTMAVGQVGGKDFASLDLKASPDVPNAFAGCNLTISYEANGVTIHFDNFMTPQQENNAIMLVEKNKEQLQQMVESLNAKNIQVTEMTIGSHTIAVPQTEGLVRPITLAESERGRERKDQGQDQQQGNQQGQQGPK